MIDWVSGGPHLCTHDYRETPVPRTAMRLIAVVFPVLDNKGAPSLRRKKICKKYVEKEYI